jgi:cellulose synthase/poly-beta-1,6-N-acetylglucosamine synthase-like glycosyltransferase
VKQPRTYAYPSFAQLAGPLREPSPDYRVGYQQIGPRPAARLRGRLLALTAVLFEAVFLVWLLWPSHYPDDTGRLAHALGMAMVASVGLIEVLRLVNIVTLCLATIKVRDPLPVRPADDTRVAFVTTWVPGKEPLAMVEATLRAALKVRHTGTLDVWLLDEGNDLDARLLCARLGVNHFSRNGIERWNQPSGPYRAKAKHGNYNAWLETAGQGYDVMIGVDTDHVPMPEMAERMLGYFRDPDVAFVVGPQVYGNYDNFVTKAAESQQYLFHSVLQRAANRAQCPMFVGTNNAVRIDALRQIGGLADSITEDAATSLRWHAARNPLTRRRGTSVYTPDVLAVGEGPRSWTDYFNQQYRWARGTDEVLVRQFPRTGSMGWRARLQYGLLMSYYPSAALSWALGALNISLYLLTGIGGVQVAARTWLALYVNAAVLQVGIYFWNRRHNVSPHEPEGSSGVLGMFISVLSAPVYLLALTDTLRRRASVFVVTAKGDSASPDGWSTFRTQLRWAAWWALMLCAAVVLGHHHPAMYVWGVLALVVSLLPAVLWRLLPPAPPTGYGDAVPGTELIDLSLTPVPATPAVSTAREEIHS